MFVEKIFSFSFGGKNDYSEVRDTVGTVKLDFSSGPIGVGLAIREGIEASFIDKKSLSFCFEVDADIDIIIEFKTKKSKGAPEKSVKYYIQKGVGSIATPIPQDLSSTLEEIVILFPRCKKEKDVCIQTMGVCLF